METSVCGTEENEAKSIDHRSIMAADGEVPSPDNIHKRSTLRKKLFPTGF
jgi:hypothetical protein